LLQSKVGSESAIEYRNPFYINPYA